MSLLSFGQNESVVNGFKADVHNQKVLLSWSITAGNTCNGVSILRSIDSINFEQIGSIEGICGSNQDDVRYTFTDLHPILNEDSYYRLELGGIGYSIIISALVIDIPENNYRIGPNPVVDNSELYFDNDASHDMIIRVYNSSGVIVNEIATNQSKVVIESTDYKTGIHLFTISDIQSGKTVRGKFIVI